MTAHDIPHTGGVLEKVVERALTDGTPSSLEEVLEIDRLYPTEIIAEAADRVRRRWTPDTIDTCSIINARSGRCGEDCKWCSQSRFHKCGVEEYDCISADDALEAARRNNMAGIQRLSLVTSGRCVSGKTLDTLCGIYRKLRENTDMHMCASMGLLNKEDLQKLRDAGVSRYHCNLETSSEYFPKLCTTHTHADKLRTIALARETGMEVCSGGIIGMGENMRDRLLLAQEVREAGAVSMPVNILNPIPGTALENTPLIDEDTIIRSIALMRLMAPKLAIRFAGGRMRLSHDTMKRALLGGVNGALMGDMLTTVGNSVDDDRKLFAEAGYTLHPTQKANQPAENR